MAILRKAHLEKSRTKLRSANIKLPPSTSLDLDVVAALAGLVRLQYAQPRHGAARCRLCQRHRLAVGFGMAPDVVLVNAAWESSRSQISPKHGRRLRHVTCLRFGGLMDPRLRITVRLLVARLGVVALPLAVVHRSLRAGSRAAASVRTATGVGVAIAAPGRPAPLPHPRLRRLPRRGARCSRRSGPPRWSSGRPPAPGHGLAGGPIAGAPSDWPDPATGLGV